MKNSNRRVSRPVECPGVGHGRGATDLEQALGQYLIYRGLIARQEPERALFFAVPDGAWQGVWSTVLGRVALEDYGVKVVVFSVKGEVIERWHT